MFIATWLQEREKGWNNINQMHDGNFHNDCPCANRLTYSNGVVMEVSNGENARGCLRDICQRLKQTAGRTNRVPRCSLLKVVCAKGCARSRKMVFLAAKGFVFPTQSLQRLNLSILIWKGGNKFTEATWSKLSAAIWTHIQWYWWPAQGFLGLDFKIIWQWKGKVYSKIKNTHVSSSL